MIFLGLDITKPNSLYDKCNYYNDITCLFNEDDPFSSKKDLCTIVRVIILAFIVLSVMHEIVRLQKHFLRADNCNVITTMIWFNNKNREILFRWAYLIWI